MQVPSAIVILNEDGHVVGFQKCGASGKVISNAVAPEADRIVRSLRLANHTDRLKNRIGREACVEVGFVNRHATGRVGIAPTVEPIRGIGPVMAIHAARISFAACPVHGRHAARLPGGIALHHHGDVGLVCGASSRPMKSHRTRGHPHCLSCRAGGDEVFAVTGRRPRRLTRGVGKQLRSDAVRIGDIDDAAMTQSRHGTAQGTLDN